MRSIKITKLLFLGAIMSILTACPPNDSGGESTVRITPAIKQDSLAFKAKSDTVLTLAFNTDIEIVDKTKIRVEFKPDGNEESQTLLSPAR